MFGVSDGKDFFSILMLEYGLTDISLLLLLFDTKCSSLFLLLALLLVLLSKLSMHVFLYDLLSGGDGDEDEEHDEADDEKENEDEAEDGVDIGGVGGDTTVLAFALFALFELFELSNGEMDCCFESCSLLSSKSLGDLILLLLVLLDVVSSRLVCGASSESCSELLIFIFNF